MLATTALLVDPAELQLHHPHAQFTVISYDAIRRDDAGR